MNKNNPLHSITKPLKVTLDFLISVGIDKYIKKFTVSKFISLMIYAQLFEFESLRALSEELRSSSALQDALQMKSISHSQISRKLRDLNPQTIEAMFKQAMKEANVLLKPHVIKSTIGNLYLIDSSTISMSFTQYPWASFRKTKSGIKLHLRLKFVDGISIPDKAIITNARPADRKQMDQLVILEEGAINVFDRAYVDYKKFDSYCKLDIRFVTRSKSNSSFNVIETFETATNSVVKSDEKVILGSGTAIMQSALRLIKTTDITGKPLTILTNVFTKTAEEIADIYRLRWKIELFFKWMKQHLRIKTFYGKSSNAVVNQIYIALITYCLLIIAKLKDGYTAPILTFVRILKACIFNEYEYFLNALHLQPNKTSRGRRRNTENQEFDAVCAEYEQYSIHGEVAEYMN